MPKSRRKNQPPPPPPIIQHGHISVDRDRKTVHLGEHSIHLTPKEAELLWILMWRANQVVSREEIMRHVWHTEFTGDTRTLEVHMRWLRKKIETLPSQPLFLHTVRGQGYKFVIPTPEDEQAEAEITTFETSMSG